MQTVPHRVRRLHWVVRTGSEEEAFAWRTFLRNQDQSLLLPFLEKAFNEASQGDRVIHIPKAELNINIGRGKELAEVLPALILQELREKLHPVLKVQQESGGQSIYWKESEAGEERVDSLLHYLRTGSLPWQAAGSAATEIAAVIRETCREEWRRVLDIIKNKYESPAFYFRLFQIATGEERSSLLNELSGRMHHVFREPVEQFITALFSERKLGLSRYATNLIASHILARSLASKEGDPPPYLLSEFVDSVPLGERRGFYEFLASLPGTVSVLFQQTGKEERHYAEQEPIQACAEVETDPVIHSSPEDDLFPFMTQQAGLVLLHPFMRPLFENTGILERGDTEFSSFALARAAALLYFLATGREEMYEYEIGFIKVLLGQHPAEPLPLCEGLLSPGDKEEADSVLVSVCKHWRALKNTSLQGLRSSFIERQALLREEESGWRLQVERKSYDILLDQLPWSTGIVKLPWMKKAIYTEWQTT